jgi:hypothetical protein
MAAKKTAKKTNASTAQTTRVADELKKVNALAAEFGLLPPLSIEARRALLSGLRPSPDFIEAAAAAWDSYGAKTGVDAFDATSARDAIALRNAQTSLVEVARTLVEQIEDRANVAYAASGAAAMTMYAALKVRTRNGANPDLQKRVETMRDLLRAQRSPRARATSKTKRAPATSTSNPITPPIVLAPSPDATTH